MPAIDQCEPQVIRALEKSGWTVTHNPFAIKIERDRVGYIFADLRLEHDNDNEHIIIVEVKCFESSRTILEEFYHAVGQCIVYRNALENNNIATKVYLALPTVAYESFFQKQLIQSVLNDIQLQLIVIDLEKEEVVEWITSNR